MAKIGRYIWNPFSRNNIQRDNAQKLPMAKIEFMCEALDTLTLAVEGGILDSDTWPEQLFASRDVYDAFIEELASYDECYRIVDRWWVGLATLVDHQDHEEGFTSTQDIADVIDQEFSQLMLRKPQWQPKKSKATAAKTVKPAKKAANASKLKKAA